MLLAPTPSHDAALSALLTAATLDSLLNLGNWASSSHDLRRGAHYQALDIDPRDPDWLNHLAELPAST